MRCRRATGGRRWGAVAWAVPAVLVRTLRGARLQEPGRLQQEPGAARADVGGNRQEVNAAALREDIVGLAAIPAPQPDQGTRAMSRELAAESRRLSEDLLGHVADFLTFRYQVVTCAECISPTLWGPKGARRTLEGHKAEVVGLSFFPLGDRLLTWSKDGTSMIWDTASGTELHRFQHDLPVDSARIFPDGDRVVTCIRGGMCVVWASGAIAPRGQAAAGTSSQAQVLTVLVPRRRSGRHRPTFDDGKSMVEVFPSGDRLLTWGRETHAAVWNAATGQVVREFGHRSVIMTLARIFPSEDRVVTCGLEDHRAFIFSLSKRRNRQDLHHSGWLMDIAVLEGGALVATLQLNGWVAIWCAETGVKLRMLGEPTRNFAYLANGFQAFARESFVTTFSAKSVRIWNASSGRGSARLAAERVDNIAVAPGEDALVACGGGKVWFWDVRSGRASPPLNETPAGLSADEVPSDCRIAISFAGVLDPQGFGKGLALRDLVSP